MRQKMTPSDNMEIKRENIPPSVSSASSLDSMHMMGREQTGATAASEPDTRQNTSVASFSLRGDEAAEAPNASSLSIPNQNQGIISPAVSAAIPSAAPLSFTSIMLPSNHLGIPVLPSGTPLTMPGTAGNNSIPEFLYQLTKMLTDNNRHIIEWTNGTSVLSLPDRKRFSLNISPHNFTSFQARLKFIVHIDSKLKSYTNISGIPSLRRSNDS